MKVKLVTSLVGGLIVILVGVTLMQPLQAQVTVITNSNEYPPAVKAITSILPIMFVVMTILGAFAQLGKDSREEQIDWLKYGERLKLAYAAKFGGENKGFNDEVDARIKIMINTDKGFSRAIAKNWVKRMSKFVDLEWLQLENSNNVG